MRRNTLIFPRRIVPVLAASALLLGLGPTLSDSPSMAAIAPPAGSSQAAVQKILVEEALIDGVVPPTLALAVAQVESNFDASALSHAGARGVMQIMPATAQGEFGVSADRLYDPRLNARLGVAFLHKLYVAYGRRWDLALSHYNGGSLTRVGGQWRPHGYTSGYVQKVMRYWNAYQRARWVGVLVAETRRDETRLAADAPHADLGAQAQLAADYAYMEDPEIDHDWRDYLRVADRWMKAGGAEAGEAAPVDFSETAAADPDWHYPLRAGGAPVLPDTAGLKGAERFLNSSRYWSRPTPGAAFN
jgi:hypothetical protein